MKCVLLVVGMTTGVGEPHPRSTGSRRQDGSRARGTFSTTVSSAPPYYRSKRSKRSDNVTSSKHGLFHGSCSWSRGYHRSLKSRSRTTAGERWDALRRLSG
jgi:hypothetical protein